MVILCKTRNKSSDTRISTRVSKRQKCACPAQPAQHTPRGARARAQTPREAGRQRGAGPAAVPTPAKPPEVALRGLRGAEAVYGRMQCSRLGRDAAAVARRRELAFVTSSARGLPSPQAGTPGPGAWVGTESSSESQDCGQPSSCSRGHATCREEPKPRREDGCRQACR